LQERRDDAEAGVRGRSSVTGEARHAGLSADGGVGGVGGARRIVSAGERPRDREREDVDDECEPRRR
jgi:hypothetical protein